MKCHTSLLFQILTGWPFPMRFVKSNLNHFQTTRYPTHQCRNTGAFETHFGKSLWSGPLSILVAESWSMLSHPTGSFCDGWLLFTGSTPQVFALTLKDSVSHDHQESQHSNIFCGSTSPFSFPVLPQGQSGAPGPGKVVSAAKASELSPGASGPQTSTQKPPSRYAQLVGMENKDRRWTNITKTVIFSVISHRHRVRSLHCLSHSCLNIWQMQLWNYLRRNVGRVCCCCCCFPF